MIDIHCHILPDIDDGPNSVDATKAMLNAAKLDGIKTVLATSHYSEVFDAEYNKTFSDTQSLALDYGIQLLPGCEYDLSLLSTADKLVSLADSSFILVDIRFPYIPTHLENMFFDYKLKGHKIIMAHPERLLSPKELPTLIDLAQKNIFYQINAASLIGRNGREVQKFACKILREGLCHYVASDAHSSKRRGFHMSKAFSYVTEKFGNDAANIIFNENPQRLIDGKEPAYYNIEYNSIWSKIINLFSR